MSGWPSEYETVADIDGVQYQISRAGVGLFGERLFQASTVQMELIPWTVRRVLGTFANRTDAVAEIENEQLRRKSQEPRGTCPRCGAAIVRASAAPSCSRPASRACAASALSRG